MIAERELWKRVNAVLDERGDPLSDERVRELCVEAPELVGELTALNDALVKLERSAPPPRVRTRIAGVLAMALAAGLVLAFALAPRGGRTPDANTAESAAPVDPRARIVDCRIEVTVTRGNATRSTLVVDGVRTHSVGTHAEPQPDGSPAPVAAILTVSSNPLR